LPLDPDAQIVFHVARHLAGPGDVSVFGLLHGLLQNERFIEAIERVGGDAAQVAEGVSFESPADARRWRPLSADEAPIRTQLEGRGGDAALALMHGIAVAQARGRLASCTDLWTYLLRTNAGVELERAGVDPLAVLFVMTHGVPEQDLSRTSSPYVHAVVRNDDYTRTDVVFRVLREPFDLPEPTAQEVIRAAESDGRAIVSRLELADARKRITRGRELARAHGYPLWLGIEDC
jgi:ATP-dependent Clp protease adapter protein ClpS